jgi:hypothetical protein
VHFTADWNLPISPLPVNFDYSSILIKVFWILNYPMNMDKRVWAKVGREPAGTSDIGVDMGKRGCARTLPNDRFTCTRAFNLCALGTSSSSAIQLSVAFAVKKRLQRYTGGSTLPALTRYF